MGNPENNKKEKTGGNREEQRKEDQDRYDKFKGEKDPKNKKGDKK